MEQYCTRDEANIYLQKLIGQPLCYGIKSYDMDLYDLGFGETANHPAFAIHSTSEIKLIQRTQDKKTRFLMEIPAILTFLIILIH